AVPGGAGAPLAARHESAREIGAAASAARTEPGRDNRLCSLCECAVMLFRSFERLIPPTRVPERPEPPPGLLTFYWHFVRQARGLFASLLAIGLVVALLDLLIPVFIGRIVHLVTTKSPDRLLAEAWPTLLAMAA